jgi:hypothetical protein
MNKSLKLYLGGIISVVLLILLIDNFRTKPVNWKPTYSLDHKKPLDLYVFNRELNTIIPENRISRVSETPYEYLMKNRQQSIYIYINQFMFSISDTILLDEVAAGSHLFISTENFFKNLSDKLEVNYTEADSDLSLKNKDELFLQLTNKSWGKKKYKLKKVLNTFAFVDANPKTTTILGNQQMPNKKVFPNFLKIKYGEGYVYLHNQPQVFSNFAMLSEKSSSEYVAHLLSYFPDKLPVVWFVKNQTTDAGQPKAENSLSVIFKYPALRATWLIFIYGILLYVLFNAKRRQRIIPEITPLANTTVEFVQTIGNLYFQQGDVANILEKKILYFLDKIRRQYFIDTTSLDAVFVGKLKNKSEKNQDLIDKIIQFIIEFRNKKTADSKALVYFNKLTEEFWEKPNKSKNLK